MKHILVGTNRPDSRSKQLALLIQGYYRDLGENVDIIDLCDLNLGELTGAEYSQNKPASLARLLDPIDSSDGLIVIAPEYNGSAPGILKLFIDHLSFPKAFEGRPVCFVGLGGRFGGLRPVEHLQQVFGYRNAFVFPYRVFLVNVWNDLKDSQLNNAEIEQLLRQQAQGFQKFCRALTHEKLHANSLPTP